MIDTQLSQHVKWRTLAPGSVRLSGGLLGVRQITNREVSLRHGYKKLNDVQNFYNLRLAAHLEHGDYRGPRHHDSDLHKWLEAVGYELGHAATEADDTTGWLHACADETIGILQGMQWEDGYLNSYHQVMGGRFTDLKRGHELYCVGHFLEAALAHHRAAGDDRLLNLAIRLADYVDSIFGEDKRRGVCGHPEVELALIELYRATREQRYLRLARYFIGERGHNILGTNGEAAHYQDRVPVRSQRKVEGHAVRSLYFLTGATDLYMETGEAALLEALLAQWQDLVRGKVYITGGAGSRYQGESYGEPYELPNERAYQETCAAIALFMWNWRLLQITGEGRFADLMERSLYNGLLSGVSVSGDEYFYVNPLSSRGHYQRQPWYECACCPPNVMRLLASLDHYVATSAQDSIQIHLYTPIRAELRLGDQRLTLAMETEYPWQGQVTLRLDAVPVAEFAIALHIPGWCNTPTVKINGTPDPTSVSTDGYLWLKRQWHTGDRIELDLPMAPVFVEAHPHVEASSGSVALMRGPLVYCLEETDQEPGVDLFNVLIDPEHLPEAGFDPTCLGGTMRIRTQGLALSDSGWSDQLYRVWDPTSVARARSVSLAAVPYLLWGNRQPGAMRVWVPRLYNASARLR